MPRLVLSIAIATLLGGCQLVTSSGRQLIKITPDQAFRCAGDGQGPLDSH